MGDSWHYVDDYMAEEDLNTGVQAMEWTASTQAEQEAAVQGPLDKGLEAETSEADDLLMEADRTLAALWADQGPMPDVEMAEPEVAVAKNLDPRIATAAEVERLEAAEAAASKSAKMTLDLAEGESEVAELPLQLPQAPTTAVGPVATETILVDNGVIESMDRYGDLETLSPRITEIIDTATIGMVPTEKEKLLRLMSTLDVVSWVCHDTYNSASEVLTLAEPFCQAHRLKIFRSDTGGVQSNLGCNVTRSANVKLGPGWNLPHRLLFSDQAFRFQ